MKKISKLFLSFILVALCLCSIIPFAACDNRNWIEVQSVTFYYDSEFGILTISSICIWEHKAETITQAEYDAAPNEIKGDFYEPTYEENIPVDRTEFIKTADKNIGTVCYRRTFPLSHDDIIYKYYKYTYKSYELKYIKVNILENDSIEIQLLDGTIRKITPNDGYLPNSQLPYEIVYFNN